MMTKRTKNDSNINWNFILSLEKEPTELEEIANHSLLKLYSQGPSSFLRVYWDIDKKFKAYLDGDKSIKEYVKLNFKEKEKIKEDFDTFPYLNKEDIEVITDIINLRKQRFRDFINEGERLKTVENGYC